VRKGVACVHLDFDGTLRFDRAGWIPGTDGAAAHDGTGAP
jgi:hypothetical protein